MALPQWSNTCRGCYGGTFIITEDSSRAAGMLLSLNEPQPNSDIHSRLPVGRTRSRSSLRMLPKYCVHVPAAPRHMPHLL